MKPNTNYIPLIGTPYEKQDCFGIVREFYKLSMGMDLKSYYTEIPKTRDVAKALVYSNLGDFIPVEEKDRQFGDLILIKIEGVESHIAVYLGEDKMLHSTLHSGCVVERMERWKKLIVGYYRVDNNDSAS